VLLSFVTPFFVDCEAVAREVVAIAASTPKPIVCVVMTEKTQWRATLEIFRQAGLPTFDLPEIGARVLGAMVRYASRNS
jgi:acyl-CoA synthetase (NDP forming)